MSGKPTGDDANYLRRLARVISHIPSGYNVHTGDVNMLRSIADRIDTKISDDGWDSSSR